MDRQARTRDTVLVMSREMTGRSQTLPWWLGEGGVKTTENKYIGPVEIQYSLERKGGKACSGRTDFLENKDHK
jgi:hypothetical protein